MRKNTFEFRNTVLNRLFSQRVRRSRGNGSQYPDEENANSSQYNQKEKVISHISWKQAHITICFFLSVFSVFFFVFVFEINIKKFYSKDGETPRSERPICQNDETIESPIDECILCCTPRTKVEMYQSSICNHVACKSCFENYLTIEITESRTEIGKKMLSLDIIILFRLL